MMSSATMRHQIVQTHQFPNDEIRDRLTEAAKARGVSVNQEINDRLAASFDRPDITERVFANRGLYGLMKLIAVAMQGAGQRANMFKKGFSALGSVNVDDTQLWFHDPYEFDQAKGRPKRFWKRAGRQAARNRLWTRRPDRSCDARHWARICRPAPPRTPTKCARWTSRRTAP